MNPSFTRTDRPLGQGTFARVFIANSDIAPGAFAWKELKEEARDSDRERFLREVRLLSTMRHKNIVPILAADIACESPYFVMPKAHLNLETAVRFDLGQLNRMQIFRELAAGLIYAHSQGIKHRDLKPDNVLIASDGTVWISDFGLATKSDLSLLTITRTNDTGGTALYSAPEQYNASLKDVDERADVYSLGRILYYLLTGDHPYCMDEKHPKIPEGLRYVIRRACRTNPEERFPSVSEMLDDADYALTPRSISRSKEDEIRGLIEAYELLGVLSEKDAHEIIKTFSNEATNSVFYLSIFPTVPAEIWKYCHNQNPEAFWRIFECYDGFVSGSLPFDYTDRVANCYSRIFEILEENRIRERILERLVCMGHSHNRWHVH